MERDLLGKRERNSRKGREPKSRKLMNTIKIRYIHIMKSSQGSILFLYN